MTTDERACRLCAHWRETISNTEGECRVQPPVPFRFPAARGQTEFVKACWPATRADDWCAAFRRGTVR